MKKKIFLNPHVKLNRQGLKDFLLWKIGYFDDEDKEEQPVTPKFSHFKSSIPFRNDEPTAVWINHSTFLLNVGGVNILTDPIWSKRCSPLSFLGPKRHHPPGIPFSELHEIDIVLISHDHYDHLDRWTVLELAKKYPRICWFVPKGVKRWFDRNQIAPVYEFGWWEEQKLSLARHPKITGKVTAVPAQHFSGRKGVDLNSTLWAGWVLEIGMNSETKCCYFVGDTGYNPFDFKKIGERFPSIDLSLIPIGSYQPKAFMETVHVCPEDAVRIHREVGSRLSIGMHWKTFCLSDEPMDRPPHDLHLALLKENIPPSKFIIIEPGDAINW